MPLNPNALQAVHDEVRAFFKHALKSANKSYLADAKGISRERLERRNLNAQKAAMLVGDMQDSRAYEQDKFTSYGKRVLSQPPGARAGNCVEQASAAGFLVRQRDLGRAWMGMIEQPGDHAFCLVGERHSPRVNNVQQLMFDRDETWIIDPWANVCCRAVDYPSRLRRKLAQWGVQGKAIERESPTGADLQVLASHPMIIAAMLTSRLAFKQFARVKDYDREFAFARG